MLLSSFHSSPSEESFNLGVFKCEFGHENLLNYLWCKNFVLVYCNQIMWKKYHSLVPLKLWNCNPLIIKSKLVALAHKGRTVKENSRRISCVYQLLKANEENFNSKSFGNLAPAMAACRVRKTVRRASPSSLDSSKLYLSVQSLSLSSTEGQQEPAISSGGPMVLKPYKRPGFVGRVAKI